MKSDSIALQAERHILLIRSQKVLLDFDLAELYGVETRALKQAVKRNSERFPEDFLFEQTEAEVDDLVSQNVIPGRGKLGGAPPTPSLSKASPCFPACCAVIERCR